MTDVFSFPNQSIAGIFLAALLLLIIPFLLSRPKKGLFTGLLVITFILFCLLLLSNSRAGWLGFAVALVYVIFRYSNINKRKIFLAAAAFFVCLFFLCILFYKADSSSGRMHIYSISVKMLKDNWINGMGLGKFKASFNEYQADYFSLHDIDSKRALLADNTFYTFNDYLQWIIETGLTGLVLLAIAIYVTVSKVIFLHSRYQNRPVLTAVTASLICVAVAAFFSYPLQVRSMQAFAAACCGVVAFFPMPPGNISILQKTVSFLNKVFVILLGMIVAYNAWHDGKRKRTEKECFELVRSGFKTAAIDKYKWLVEKYPATGYNWLQYAQQLYYANRLSESIEVLNKGSKYYIDNKVYRLKANIEQELGLKAEAEKNYLRAIYMVPNRMGSRADIVNFYVANNDTANVIYWARSILNMPVKVPSSRVDTLRQQARSVLDKFSITISRIRFAQAKPFSPHSPFFLLSLLSALLSTIN